MNLTKQQYAELVKKASPNSKLLPDCLWAFVVGGAICLLGQLLRSGYMAWGMTLTDAGTLSSASLVALSAIATSFGWYQKLASKAGAGTLVPITGFANAVVSPAIEFKADDRVIIGTSQKHHEIKVDVLV